MERQRQKEADATVALTLTLTLTMMLAVVLIAGVPAAATAADSADGRANGLTLKMVDTYQLFTNGARSASEQVADIFAEIGVTVDWNEPTTAALPEPGKAELLVYLRPNRPEKLGLDKNVLGAVLSGNKPQRVLYIFLPRVAESAGAKLGGNLSAEDQRNLARALARVVVHEAFHAIAPKLPHAKTGLTSAKLTQWVLVRGKAEIDAEAARVFRVELAGLWEAAATKTSDFGTYSSGAAGGPGGTNSSGWGSSGVRSRPESPGWSDAMGFARNEAYGSDSVPGGCQPGTLPW